MVPNSGPPKPRSWTVHVVSVTVHAKSARRRAAPARPAVADADARLRAMAWALGAPRRRGARFGLRARPGPRARSDGCSELFARSPERGDLAARADRLGRGIRGVVVGDALPRSRAVTPLQPDDVRTFASGGTAHPRPRWHGARQLHRGTGSHGLPLRVRRPRGDRPAVGRTQRAVPGSSCARSDPDQARSGAIPVPLHGRPVGLSGQLGRPRLQRAVDRARAARRRGHRALRGPPSPAPRRVPGHRHAQRPRDSAPAARNSSIPTTSTSTRTPR